MKALSACMDDEVKILTRGDYYMTPLKSFHREEFKENLSEENKQELAMLGHTDLDEVFNVMSETAQAYVVRRTGKPLIFVGGILYSNGDTEFPQMFALFSDKVKDNFKLLARGSKMLMSFFDQSEMNMSMTVLAKNEAMVQWATWLGFEAIGVQTSNNHDYVEFVRCNFSKKNVSHETSRPVMH